MFPAIFMKSFVKLAYQ